MILIVVKFAVRPEYAEEFIERAAPFTRATRAEEGNLFFEWSRSVEDENEFVLVEGFRDGDAGAAHVSSPHFKRAIEEMPAWLSATPRIIHVEAPGDDWSTMGELSVP